MTATPDDSLAEQGAGVGAGVDSLGMSTADRYTDFAIREAHGASPTYERLALAIARDTELLALLTRVPFPKRQPNLLLAVVRMLGGPVDDPRAFHDFTLANWEVIETELHSRATQTNEVGRCALLLPILASLPQRLALLEAGCSAGLGLYPDRYSYRYGDHELGTSGPILDCALTGTAPPTRLPEIVWRAGLDLNPLDSTDPADLAWLEALVWPEHRGRQERLRAAAAIANGDPPTLITGDLVDDLTHLAAQAPAPPDHTLHNVLALDGWPLAWTRSHGQTMQWFAGPGAHAITPPRLNDPVTGLDAIGWA